MAHSLQVHELSPSLNARASRTSPESAPEPWEAVSPSTTFTVTMPHPLRNKLLQSALRFQHWWAQPADYPRCQRCSLPCSPRQLPEG
jgi:hypothetical protein